MKDEQALEEKLMAVLDRMYRHVADLENGPGPAEHHHNPNEDGQMSDQEFLPHAKIILSRKQNPCAFRGAIGSIRRRTEAEKQAFLSNLPDRRVLFRLLLAFVLVILLSNVMIGRRSSEKGQPQQVTFPIYLKPSLHSRGRECPSHHRARRTTGRDKAATNR